MAASLKLDCSSTHAGRLLVFYETSETGVFDGEITLSSSNQTVSSSGATIRAVAVPINPSYRRVDWVTLRSTTEKTEYGLISASTTSTSGNANRPEAYVGTGACSVTVIDQHGSHTGTGSQSVNNNQFFGCRHKTTESGYVYLGARVTLSTPLAASVISSGGETDGLVTTFPASYDGAIVLQARSGSVTIEHLYREVSQVSITFARNAIDVSGPDIPPIETTAGSACILPDAVLWQRDGWVFTGWATASGVPVPHFAAGDSIIPTEDIILYAVWSQVSGDGARHDTYQYGNNVTTSTERAKIYYAFVLSSNLRSQYIDVTYQTRTVGRRVEKRYNYGHSWNSNPTVTTKGDTPAGPTVTLSVQVSNQTAIAVPGDYIDYYYSTTWGSTQDTKVVDDVSVTTPIGSDWEIAAPEVEHFDFDGWYTIGFSSDDPSALSALTDEDYTVKVGDSLALNMWDAIRKSNSILWMIDATGVSTTRKYYNYLKAKYIGKPIFVLLDANGGDLHDFWREVRYSGHYGLLPTPIRNGYLFTGWYLDDIKILSDSQVDATEDHTLVARWAKVAGLITVSFAPCGGSTATPSKTVAEGDAIGELPVPTRSGYDFDGWHTGVYSGDLITRSTVPSRSMTVYAHWRALETPVDSRPPGEGSAKWYF